MSNEDGIKVLRSNMTVNRWDYGAQEAVPVTGVITVAIDVDKLLREMAYNCVHNKSMKSQKMRRTIKAKFEVAP